MEETMRVVKEYTVRKNEILDTSQRLFYSIGYDRTTVEAIINEAGIAKGTFYYYFKSKLDLLDNLVDRMVHQMMAAARPIIEAETDSIEKLRNLFNIIGTIKLKNMELLLQVLKILYRDENLITRYKMNKKFLEKFGPLFSRIVRQGVRDGTFNTAFPDDAGELIIQLGTCMSDNFAILLLELDKKPSSRKILETKVKMYENTIERIVGAEEGSLKLFDTNMLDLFFRQEQSAEATGK